MVVFLFLQPFDVYLLTGWSPRSTRSKSILKSVPLQLSASFLLIKLLIDSPGCCLLFISLALSKTKFFLHLSMCLNNLQPWHTFFALWPLRWLKNHLKMLIQSLVCKHSNFASVVNSSLPSQIHDYKVFQCGHYPLIFNKHYHHHHDHQQALDNIRWWCRQLSSFSGVVEWARAARRWV